MFFFYVIVIQLKHRQYIRRIIMAKNRLIGDYPVIGIRPTIDGRRGKIKVRESLEDQTMNMAKAAAKLIEENVFYSNGEHVSSYC